MNKINKELYSDLTKEELLTNLIKKLELFFLISEQEKKVIFDSHAIVLDRLERCIIGVDNKYFKKGNKSYFSYTHSGQYLMYLYFFSNEFSKNNEVSLKDKFYYLNKILHSVDIYAEVELPEVFFLEHPIGTVLGRATYGENFFAMQGCTIGGNKNSYPILGNNLKMYSNSKILGKCNIGHNVVIGANTYIKDTNIPDFSMVFGQFPNLIIKDIK